MLLVGCGRVAELTGLGDNFRGLPEVRGGKQPDYNWKWRVRNSDFHGGLRVQLTEAVVSE
jgi:hypothetical protein